MASVRAGRIDDPVWRSSHDQDPWRHRARLDRRRVALVAALVASSLVFAWAIFAIFGFDWAMVLVTAALLVALFFVGSRRASSTVAFAVVLLLVGFGWLEAVNAVGYHTLDLGGPPPKVVHCGRAYLLDPTPVATSAVLQATDRHFAGEWSTLVTPSGTRVLLLSCRAGVTPTLLHTPAHDGHWFEYSLSGGP